MTLHTKTCSACQKQLPADPRFFHRDARQPSGLRPTCKACRNPRVAAQQREYQARPEVREQKQVYMREYLDRPGAREKSRRYSREYWRATRNGVAA